MAFQKFTLNSGLMLIATILFSTAGNTEYNSMDYYISQDYVVPLYYNVEIRYFSDDNVLFGLCGIIINISRPLNSIMLYSVPIKVTDAILINHKNNITHKLIFLSWSEKDILTFHFDKEVHPALYSLNITYMRNVHEIKGNFFRYAYLEESRLGDEKLIVTYVKIMKARQLFPCRDEQTTKSTFKIAIKHHEKYTVLSNMHIQEKYKNDNTMIWTVFEKSFLMPVQNIVVVITTYINQTVIRNTNITVWCRPSAIKHITYAKNIFKAIVPQFRQKYFPDLPKLDIVLLSQDDMQPQYDNASTSGLLLQRDIIYNKKYHPHIRKREIAHIIARQLAFVWCSDVLLWSKEGFATFFGAYILNEVFQNDYMMDLFVVQTQQDSLRYDNPSTTEFEANLLKYPSNNLKSFIIWRMLYHVIPGSFWIGIRRYIDKQRNYLKMTTSDDLWNTMDTVHKDLDLEMTRSIKPIINNWITKNYYSVLNVTRNYKKSILMIKYSASPSVFDYNQIQTWIPVTYTTNSSLNYGSDKDMNVCFHCKFLMNEHTYFTEFITNDWTIFNVQQTGYYRVNYDFENWNKLVRYLDSENYTKIHILNRAQIIDDAFYFLLQKQFSYREFWNLTNFLVLKETNFVVWYPMFKAFEFLSCKFPLDHDIDIVEKMKIVINGLFTRIVRTPSQTDHSLIIYLKEEALKWECILGFPECREWAFFQLWEEFRHSVNNTNISGKKLIYCYGVKKMKSFSSEILSRFKVTSDIRFLEYLTCVEDDDIISDYLSQVIHYDIHLENSTRATEILRTVAKHAKRDNVLSSFFANFTNATLSSNKKNDIIAILIVIITHVHSSDQMKKIHNSVMGDSIVYITGNIVKAVKDKIKRRKSEYRKLIRNYGSFAGI